MEHECRKCQGLMVRELVATQTRMVPLTKTEYQRRWCRRSVKPVELVQYDIFARRCLNCGSEIFLSCD
jgi:hypothetical protein